MKNILGFSVTPNMSRVMECDGRFASIMRSEKKTGSDNGLPPGMPIPVLPVDYLKERPKSWIGGQGSYVCPVDSNWGLWFNWTMNNPYDSAVLVSVKGMNPITGQRISGLGLEQYKNKCPIHKTDLKHGKLCPDCNLKWPDQNYISHPNPFYLDGFRNSDGTVRQFYFTEEMSKSIPELVIGKEDTVPAFGFCFYSLKEQKANYENGNRLKDEGFKKFFQSRPQELQKLSTFKSGPGSELEGLGSIRGMSSSHIYFADSSSGDYYTCSSSSSSSPSSSTSSINLSSKKRKSYGSGASVDSDIKTLDAIIKPSNASMLRSEVGVGAGSEIAQRIENDRRSLDSWQNKPSAIFRVYFVFQEVFEKYAESGLNNLKGSKEGYLESLPVGATNE